MEVDESEITSKPYFTPGHFSKKMMIKGFNVFVILIAIVIGQGCVRNESTIANKDYILFAKASRYDLASGALFKKGANIRLDSELIGHICNADLKPNGTMLYKFCIAKNVNIPMSVDLGISRTLAGNRELNLKSAGKPYATPKDTIVFGAIHYPEYANHDDDSIDKDSAIQIFLRLADSLSKNLKEFDD